MSPGDLAAIVVPVFAFIGIGVLIVRARILPAATGDVLGDFVFTLAVPVLIFRSVGTLTLPDVSPWPFWATYFAAVAPTLLVAAVLAEKVFGRDPTTGVVACISAGFANTVMVGVPLVSGAYGEEGLVTLFLLVAVHLPVMMAVSAVLIELAAFRAGGRPRPVEALRRVGVALVTSPIVIAIACGFALRLTGLPLTGIVREVVDRVADTAIPLALISLGMTLNGYGVRGNVAPAAALAALKLGLMPGVVLLLATTVTGLPALPTAVLVLTAACPTGINAYLIATKYRAGLALSASTITLTTAVSLLTFSFWLAVLAD